MRKWVSRVQHCSIPTGFGCNCRVKPRKPTVAVRDAKTKKCSLGAQRIAWHLFPRKHHLDGDFRYNPSFLFSDLPTSWVVEEETLRVEDYRFYGRFCLILGLILVLIGAALPVLATIIYKGWPAGSLAALYFGSPLLGSGVIVAVIGIWFILIGQVLYREYRLRRKVRDASMTESQKITCET